MNIFISYGHKDYPDFIKRFVSDLEKKFTVWTDEKIKLGDSWATEIDNAIRKSDIFLFLMAADSIREGSYCYGEIIYAKNVKKKIIVVSLESVVAPTIITQEQYFSMENVFDICGDFLEDKYLEVFPEFILKLEQSLSDPENSSNKQKNYLKHFDNTQRLKTLTNDLFLEQLFFDLINDWIKSDRTHFVLLGNAGSGKSTAAAAVYNKYKENSVIHFCDYANEKTTNTGIILQSVAKGLMEISNEYSGIISETINFEHDINGLSLNDIFETLFLMPFAKIPDNHPVLIAILDGVDEIPQKQKRDFCRIFLKRINELPKQLKIFMTSRKDSEIFPVLNSIGADILDKFEVFNNNSIKRYVANYLKDNSIKYDDNCLNEIIIQSKGDFLYIKFILEEIKLRQVADITNIVFPIKMKGVCQSYFDRIFSEDSDYYDNIAAPFLEIMTIIKMPISADIIAEILNIDDFDIKQLIKKLDMFIELRENRIMLIHKSIHDWLRNIKLGDKYYISIKRAHKNICDYIEKNIVNQKNRIDSYIFEYGFMHLAESERFDKISKIAAENINSLHDIFINFIRQILRFEEDDFLIKIFNSFSKDNNISKNVDYVVAEVIKIVLQYGKKGIVKSIVSCFSEKDYYDRLVLLTDFYEAKSQNKNTSIIIEKGECLLKENTLNINIIAEIKRILGDAYREKGEHSKAVKLYTESKDISLKNGQTSLFLDCECALIDMEYVIGNEKCALSMLEELKPMINFKTPDIYTYKYYRLLGQVFHVKNEINEAMSAFSECLNISAMLRFPLKQIETNNSLAELQLNYEIAREYIEISRNLCRSTGLNSLEFGKSYYIEAELLLKNEKTDETLKCIDTAIKILQEVGYGSGCARSYFIKGKALFKKEDYKQALFYFEKSCGYYIRECIYPALRLEAYYYMLKCAEKLNLLHEYRNFDNISYFNIEQFPHMKSILETVKCMR